MEDRKRPALSSADELAPPSKRVAVNGAKTKDDANEMKEEGWIDVSVRREFFSHPTHPQTYTRELNGEKRSDLWIVFVPGLEYHRL